MRRELELLAKGRVWGKVLVIRDASARSAMPLPEHVRPIAYERSFRASAARIFVTIACSAILAMLSWKFPRIYPRDILLGIPLCLFAVVQRSLTRSSYNAIAAAIRRRALTLRRERS